LLAGAVVLAVTAAGVLILLSRPPADEGLALAPILTVPLDTAIPVAGRAMGDPAAPVTVVEWGDYQ
jgi:hypothetical protein